MIIDGKNLVLGKAATMIAKAALEGQVIDLVNCEQMVITGKKSVTLAKHKQRYARGTHAKGPFQPKTPDRFVKRSVRGMIPYKTERGKKAMKNITCHVGVPQDFASKKPQTLKTASVLNSHALEYISVGDVCKALGQK